MAVAWALCADILKDVIQFQAFFSVVILCGFIVAAHLLQRRQLDRVSDVMDSSVGMVKTTLLFIAANEYFERRKPPKSVDLFHTLPFLGLLGIVLFFSLVAYFGAAYPGFAQIPSYVLGGQMAFGNTPAGKLTLYQSSTVFMMSLAFLVAYIRTIARLIERINTNDMRPISYYFLSIDILTAVLVAIVTRHIAAALTLVPGVQGDTTPPAGLAVLGFVIGWNPRLWLDVIWKKATEYLKIAFLKPRPPNEDYLPQDMNLMMIQGLVGDKIDRLNELGIDNCQDLAERNAVVVWLRTPFTLELVSDWIAQAQLCILYEDERIELLRKVGIRDIFGYVLGIADPEGAAAIAAILNTAPSAADAAAAAKTGASRPAVSLPLLATHSAAIAAEPAYRELKELRAALTAAPAVSRS